MGGKNQNSGCLWWVETAIDQERAWGISIIWDNGNIYTLIEIWVTLTLIYRSIHYNQFRNTTFTTSTSELSHSFVHSSSNPSWWAITIVHPDGQPAQPTLSPTPCSGPPWFTGRCQPCLAPSNNLRRKNFSFTLEKTFPFHLSLQRYYDVGRFCNFNPFYRLGKVTNLLQSYLLVGRHSPGC